MISERVFTLLEQQNKTQAQFAKALGITTQTISTWKNRPNDPPAKHISAIADFLQVSTDYLLTGTEAKKTPPSSLTDDESEILDVYRQLDRRGQARMLTSGYEELDRMKGGQAATSETGRNAG